ncbi:hypothetical protein GCM10027187_07610 [Streptosporangium sandarakinum]
MTYLSTGKSHSPPFIYRLARAVCRHVPSTAPAAYRRAAHRTGGTPRKPRRAPTSRKPARPGPRARRRPGRALCPATPGTAPGHPVSPAATGDPRRDSSTYAATAANATALKA